MEPSLEEASAIPITILPDDILREVFRFSTFYAPLTIPPLSKSHPLASSLVISCVCRHWRELALSSPELWSDIKFLGAQHIKGPNHHGQEFLATYLTRASTRPLTFDLWNHLRGFQDDRWVLDPLENVIKPHSERLRSLRLTLTYDEVKTFLTLPSDTLSQLEELEIAGHRRYTPDPDDLSQPMDWPDPTSSLMEFPSLKKASLEFPRETFDADVWRFNWSQMTTIHLCHMFMDADKALDLLRLCPELEEISLCIRSMSATLLASGILRDMEHIFLPELRSFGISFQSDMWYSEFLRVLTMPKLEEMKFGNGFAYWKHEPFSKFIERSGCRIRELTIGLLGFEPLILVEEDGGDNTNTGGGAGAQVNPALEDQIRLIRPQLETSLRELKWLEKLHSQCAIMFTKEFRDAFRKGEVLPGLKVLDLMVVNPFKDHRDDGVAHVLKELVGMVEGRWALVKERQRDLASVGGTVKGVSEACDSLVQQKQGSLPLLLPVHGEVNGGVHSYPYTNGRISVPSPVNVPSNVAVDKVVPLNKLIWDIRETEHNTFCFENFERLARLEEMGTSVKRRGSGS